MAQHPSEWPLERQELARVGKRISFLYVERAVVNRSDNALTITDDRGVCHVPATTLGVLLLGPGTRITYAAMSLLGDAGVSAVWVGEKGVRYYAHGRPPAKTAAMAIAQATIVTNQRRRLQCARDMYQMRFPGEDVAALTMSQLRGREGVRVKRIYAEHSERTGVHWNRRDYDPNDYDSGDPINQALTTANAALYGVAHAVIVALGFVPALGVVHSGTDRSFVYDIADLYKADISIPAAFDVVSQGYGQLSGDVRRAVRDKIVEHKLMQKMTNDLMSLMDISAEDAYTDADLVLWSELEVIAAGINWGSSEIQ